MFIEHLIEHTMISNDQELSYTWWFVVVTSPAEAAAVVVEPMPAAPVAKYCMQYPVFSRLIQESLFKLVFCHHICEVPPQNVIINDLYPFYTCSHNFVKCLDVVLSHFFLQKRAELKNVCLLTLLV